MPRLKIFILILVVLLDLAAAGTTTASSQLKVVYNVGVAPLKFEDADSRPAGLFPDIWRLWAQKTGKQIKFVRVDSFAESLQLLKNGEVDLHAGLFRTEEREAYLDYSEPLLALDYYIFTHPSIYPIRSLEKTAGFFIGLQKGGYTERYVRSRVPANRIILYDRFQDLFRAALEGEIKVFVATKLSLYYYLKENYQTDIFEYRQDKPLFSQVYYTASRKGNPALIQQINAGLNAISRSERKHLEDKWSIPEFKDISQESMDLTSADRPRISLTREEQAFINAHPVIRVHNEKAWPPFNYYQYGSPRGLSIDYMNLVAQQLGIKIQYVTGPSWNEFLAMVKRKELDAMLNIVKTEDRLDYLLFTDTYMKNPNVIVSSAANPYETIQSLFGETVAFPKGFFYEEVLTKSFPRIKRLPVEDTLTSLKAVTFGRADAALGEAAVVRTLINENLLSGLRISGEVNIGDPDLTNLRIGVRNDWPLLQSALKKAMAAVTPQEMNQIRQKWIVAATETTTQSAAMPISYGRLIGYALAVFLILSILAWILIKKIQKEYLAVKIGSHWFRGLVLAGLSIYVIIVCLLGWLTLEQNKENILNGVDQNLREVIRTADDRLHLWVAQRTSFLKLLGRDPELVKLTRRLLAVAPEPEELLASDALQNTRAFFKNNKDIFSNIGFFIINSDHVSIGSMRDANIGTRNLISKQKPDLLRRAFEGEVMFVPPIESDVPLGNVTAKRAGRNPPTKFFMGPIRDGNGKIIAVMTLRIDPSEDLSRAIPSPEIRKSGETYVFSDSGLLLSESRFDEQLRRIGLIGKDQKSALTLTLRDPGVNLVKGHLSQLAISQQPLTHLASRVIELKRNMEKTGQTYGHSKIDTDTKGSRDYRGVPVFGACLWNADLGLGLATKIDVDEALSNYYRIRWMVFGMLGFTLLLSVGAVLLVLILGERTSRALLKAQDELEHRVQERTAELRKLSQATENSPATVVITDKAGTIEYVNPTFSEVTGYSADEAIGQNPRVLKSGDLPESFYKELWDTILAGNVWRGEFVNKRKNGEEFWESASISPITDDDGDISHFVAVKQDMTERKAAEEALRNSERYLTQIIDFLPEATFIIDTEGRVVFWNREIEELLGIKADDILGKGRYEYALPFYGERRPILIDLALKPQKDWETKYSTIKRHGDIISGEAHIPNVKSKNNQEAYFWGVAAPLYDSEGNIMGAIECIRDITDRKQMEQDLLEAKDRLQAIIDGVHSLVFIKDTQGKHLLVNSYFEEAFGMRKQEVIGKTDRDIFSPEIAAQIMAIDRKVMTSGEPIHLEVSIPHSDGSVHIHLTEKFPLRTKSGEVYAMCGLATDITHQKDIEQELQHARRTAEEATRAKSDFLANMSHEIRTPMNAVIGMAHLALRTDLTSKQRDYLNKIQSSANSLLGIINDILDFSKIEAGKLDMEAVEFDLSETLDNVANVITVKAQEKENLEVLFNLDTQVPDLLVGDPLRLNQILVNLGNNAVKFTEQGEIVLSTKVKKKSGDQVTLQFSIRDTGIGMSEEQQARLFRAFSQADTSTTRKFGGTGLGLTISRRLVNLMGGEIQVQSALGRGTTFSFTADFGLGEESLKKVIVPLSDLNGLKVLVVDDNATSRNILRDMLASFSFDVLLAVSGEDALAKVEKADRDRPFELVVMDWKMPGMDGIEASRLIKYHSALRKIPAIVLVTAYGREELVQQADEIGLEGFLLKPVSSSVLFDAIVQALGKGVEDVSRAEHKKDKDFESWRSIRGARILLVEDNEINQQVAKEILEGAGLTVTIANDGKEGVDAAMNSRYDAVLMDIQMPVMDGYTATRKIREWENGIRNSEGGRRNASGKDSDLEVESRKPKPEGLPIIAMTAHAMAGDEQKSIASGMNDHVTKPIAPNQLFTALHRWIEPAAGPAVVAKPPETDAPTELKRSVLDEGGLPESLPGFDLAAGLKRLMGNKRLYRKLLLDFGSNYSGVADKIRAALANSDFKQAHSQVHNLKGLAGNLEATDLQQAATDFEKLVKGQTAASISEQELHRKYAAMENALKKALEAVYTLGAAKEEKATADSKTSAAVLPPKLLKKVAESIKTAVELGDVMKIKAIVEELKCESDALAPLCSEIGQLAENFDFDGIQKLMLELYRLS